MKKAIKTFSARAAMMLLATLLLTMTAQTAWAQGESLPAPDGNGDVTLDGGEYIVNSDVTISGNITAENPVNLTISSGATLSVGGYIFSNELRLTISSGSKLSLESMEPKDISMYSVDIQGGTISGQECNISVNTFNMNGGTVKVNRILFSSGTIQNATIEAYSVDMSGDATISGSTIVSNFMTANGVTFSGSDVTVSSELSLRGAVVFDAFSPGINIKVGEYDNDFGGTLTISNGNLTDGQNIYTGTIATPSVLNGKTLTYYNASSAITVSLNWQGGSGGTESVTPTAGEAMPTITPPTRTGYTFGGYYTQTNGGGTQIYKADGTSEYECDFTGTVTLYAKWTAKTYTVTLDRQGGSGGPASVTATYGSAMLAITPPTRTYYEFGGYYTETNGGGVKYYNADGTSARSWGIDDANTTLYAYWKKYLSNEDITIEIPAQTYNGSMLTPVVTVKDNGYVVSDEHYTITLPDGLTNAGDYTINIEAKEGSTAYVGATPATFTITPKAVTITAGSDSKTYDGTALTKNTYTNTDLAACDHIESVTVAGSQTDAGTSDNVPSAAVIKNSSDEDVTANYDITYANGTLTVNPKPVTITADSDSKTYDGTPLTNDSYTSTLLAAEDFIESVTVAGSQTIVGSSDNVPSDAVIKNSNGEDVTANYDITYANGTLTVNRMEVTITADSDMKEYDGTPLTNDSYTSTLLAEGDHIESVTVAGSQTDAGTSDNVPSAAIIKNSIDEDVTANYDITYVNGTLIVMSNEEILSIEIDDITYEWKSDTKTFKVARCNSTSSSLVIPGRIEYNHVWYYVTEIGAEAFMDNTFLLSIDISHDPCPIEIIGARAFKNCSNLPEIILPASLTIIEEEAFEGCAINTLEIPASVTVIGDKAFADCPNLTSVTITGGDVELGENAFEGCNGNLIIYVPEGTVDSYRSRWPDANIQAIGTIPYIPYIAADGSKAYCEEYTVLDGSNDYTVIERPGWYVVTNSNTNPNVNDGVDVSYPQGLTFDVENGNVNLILCDDAEMSIEVEGRLYAMQVNGNSFNIYGQSGGTGKLTISNNNDYGIHAVSCDMTIYGGTISAIGGYKGIYASGCNVTINGGSVTATATKKDPNEEEESIGIKAKGEEENTNYGKITINGGTVEATGKDTGIYTDNEIIISDGGIEATGQNTGIFAGSDITISGGSVEVTGGSYGISNYEGDVNIVGGVVTVSGSDGISIDGNITLGWSNASDRITVSSFAFWGDITIINGQSFYNGEIIIPTDITGKVTDRVNLEGKTLIGVDVLNDAAENDIAALKTRLDGKETNVVLNGRTLTKDGNWNTLCLPFDLGDPNATTNHWFDDTPLEGATVMTLGNSQACNTGLNAQTGTLNLEFLPADCIEAGVPYIVKWTKPSTYVPYVDPDTNLDAYNAWLAADPANRDIHNPVFTGVTVSSDEPTAVKSYDNKVAFVGQYSPFSIGDTSSGTFDGDINEIIMLGSGSTLGYSQNPRTLRCFRAHFYVRADGGVQQARAFVVDFGNGDSETTGIMSTTDFTDYTEKSDAWYNLDGRKLGGQPTKKGVYIQNGKKVVIK